MFLTKKAPSPAPTTQESDGIEIKIRLSEATLVKLIPLAIAVLLGSGVWVHTAQSPPLPVNSSVETIEGSS
jgi:hypothetical protein